MQNCPQNQDLNRNITKAVRADKTQVNNKWVVQLMEQYKKIKLLGNKLSI